MDYETIMIAVIIAFPCVLLWRLFHVRKERHSQSLPPGPRRSRWPFVGNAFDMPYMERGIKPWIIFDSWAKEYGRS